MLAYQFDATRVFSENDSWLSPATHKLMERVAIRPVLDILNHDTVNASPFDLPWSGPYSHPNPRCLAVGGLEWVAGRSLEIGDMFVDACCFGTVSVWVSIFFMWHCLSGCLICFFSYGNAPKLSAACLPHPTDRGRLMGADRPGPTERGRPPDLTTRPRPAATRINSNRPSAETPGKPSDHALGGSIAG